MKVIIDIPKSSYDKIIKDSDPACQYWVNLVRNGTPLTEQMVERLERGRGRWISKGKETGALGIAYMVKECSCCGFRHSLVIPMDYCPNCGADMRGRQDE